MLGKIIATKSVLRTVTYNEQKVTAQKASFLLGENFIKQAEQLTFHDKLDRLQQLTSLHAMPRTTAHVFLTFDPQDQLSNENAALLGKRYMEAAGFGDQPYLGYRHFDAWHPHLHLVSTIVRADRTLITWGRGQLKSLVHLTNEFEREFSLKTNQEMSLNQDRDFDRHTQQVVHGEGGLKRGISNVLGTVIDHYKYTSLEDLNAVLREYNIKADRGHEGTRLYKNRGLVYAVLDEQGHQISRGIKASSFRLKPTLPYLEKKFELNLGLQDNSRQRVETAIEWTFATKQPDWAGFQHALARESIDVVVQEEKGGKPGSLFFVDHREKAVFSGESLGSQYNLQGLQERCVREQRLQEEETQQHHLRLHL